VGPWYEDFRADLALTDVPTPVIHGGADRILPISVAGQRTAKLVRGARCHLVKGAPHFVPRTQADEVNSELLNFLGDKTASRQQVA
jgi:non-heme chloroperoxidase